MLRACLRLGEPVELGEARRLVPGSGSADPETPSPAPGDARFRLFDAVVGVLAQLADARLVVVALDDLQWADEGSLLLLEFAARHLRNSPVLILGAYQDVAAASAR